MNSSQPGHRTDGSLKPPSKKWYASIDFLLPNITWQVEQHMILAGRTCVLITTEPKDERNVNLTLRCGHSGGKNDPCE